MPWHVHKAPPAVADRTVFTNGKLDLVEFDKCPTVSSHSESPDYR